MNREYKRGLIYGILGNIFVGFQPIIANSRPSSLDAHIFAAMTCIIEMLIFLPLVLMEIYKPFNKKQDENSKREKLIITLKNWKKNIWLLIFIGFIFGINQLLFFIGYSLAGAINGSLTQKTTVFFGLIFGFLILKEKISRKQVIFSITLFLGLIIAITQGSFISF
ncbi:MAG: EamA family transporter, partial [Promethearchaeota archaeon]